MSLQLFAAATDHAIAWGVPSVLALLSGALLYAIWQVVKSLQAQINGLSADMNSLRAEVNSLRADMNELRAEMRTEINTSMTNFRMEIRAEMQAGFQRMEDKIDALTVRMGITEERVAILETTVRHRCFPLEALSETEEGSKVLA